MMASQRSGVSRNPLLRRVTRHTRLAILQRMPDPASGAASQVDYSGLPQHTVVTAHLWNPGYSQSATPEPASDAISRQPAVPSAPPAQVKPPVQVTPPVQRTPSIQPAQTSAAPQPAPVQRTPLPPAPQPAPSAPAERQPEDKTWRRLQTIFRKHQELENAQTAPGVSSETTEVAPHKTVEASSQPVNPSVDIEAPPGQPATPHEQPSEPPSQAPSPVPPESLEGTARLTPQRGSTQNTVQASPSVADRPTSLPGPQPRPDAPPGSTPEDTVQRQPAPVPQSQKSAEVSRPAEPAAQPTVDDEVTGLSDQIPSGEETPFTAQALPLEAVWPVQTIRTRPARADSPAAAPAEAGSSTAVLPDQVDDQELNTLRTRLDQVAPGQSSDSSIELIPPRHPRPVSRETQTAVQPTTAARPQVIHETAPEVQREVPSSLTEAAPQTAQPIEPSSTATARTKPAQQPQADVHPAQAAESEEENIPTAIGPLPGDLWRLIGEPSPKTEAGAKPATVQAKPAASVEHPADAAVVEPHPPEAPRAVPLEHSTAALIQRQAETERAEAPDTSQSSPQTEQAEEQQPGEEVDIDQLARRVYAEVRRRMSVEWERMRKRW